MSELLNSHIVIFDGVCHFCIGSVNIIINRDSRGIFGFVPRQSRFGQTLIQKYKVPEDEVGTILLIKNGQCYRGADAVLEITKDLNGIWPLYQILKQVPRPVRDLFYNVFARNRYKLFGKRDTCMLPRPDVIARFIKD